MFRKLGSQIAGLLGDQAQAVEPVDLTSDAFLADPVPIYDAFRKTRPLAQVQGGGYLLTRAVDIVAALSDSHLGNAPSRFSALSEGKRATHVSADVAANIPPFLDKPRHVEIRRPVSAAFYQSFAACKTWLPQLADHQISAMARGVSFDANIEFARPFAIAAMARFVGLPHDPTAISQATDALFSLFAPIQSREALDRTNTRLAEARHFIEQVMAQPALDPQCFLAQLSPHLSPQAVCDNALLILADGVENIAAGVATFFVVMQQNPDVWRSLQTDPGQLANAVHEALRLESPAQIIPRIIQEETVLHGITLKPGTPLFLALGSANRDPDAYDEPATFDLARDARAALIFGRGRHACIGTQLGLLLIEAAVSALLAAGVTMQFTPADLHYQHRFGHRWPLGVMIDLPD